MIVSWNWLKDYLPLEMSPAELANRLAMAGLNHESTAAVGDDLAIDLEVTSNRPDCLGHIGVAREIAVLWDQELTVADPRPAESSTAVSKLARVEIECPELCPRYVARVIRGVRVGPSPEWLARRLHTLGIAVICNVVDITNYVLMECGQPLHAFDATKLQGRRIIVRDARPEEPFTAIDHRTYTLQPGMCVIADDSRPVALGGVMGGEDTEVSSKTTEVLLEAAQFHPLSIRSTARTLRLHSPSSYRFERGVDPEGLDWASRRACELILELAGGELARGAIDVQPRPRPPRPPVTLRFSQLRRVLGIDLDRDEVLRILRKLGLEQQQASARDATFLAPSWRRDLSREIDLVEEVARIHGYDEIPEDVGVPMAPSHRRDTDRVLQAVQQVLLANGFHEAMTPSVSDEQASQMFSPWTKAEPLRCSTPMLRGADCLRRSLIPSLLESRRVNESLANDPIELFETAKVYLPRAGQLPDEQPLLALTSGRPFLQVKGILEGILEALHVEAELTIRPGPAGLLDADACCQLELAGEVFGFMGHVSESGLKSAGLRKPTTVAEVKLGVLESAACLVPQYRSLSPFPAISFDFNFIVDDAVRWADLAATVRDAGGECLEAIDYQETYRDPQRDGTGRKRLLLSVRLRSVEQTLTGQQADAIHEAIVAACRSQHGAQLLA